MVEFGRRKSARNPSANHSSGENSRSAPNFSFLTPSAWASSSLETALNIANSEPSSVDVPVALHVARVVAALVQVHAGDAGREEAAAAGMRHLDGGVHRGGVLGD